MKSVLSAILVGVLVIGLMLGLTWIIMGNDFFLYKAFAPKYEGVRRQTFEQSRAFNQGMVQELQNMQFKYIQEKDPKAQEALGAIILHRASGYNLDDPIVPSDLREFISDLKEKQELGQ